MSLDELDIEGVQPLVTTDGDGELAVHMEVRDQIWSPAATRVDVLVLLQRQNLAVEVLEDEEFIFVFMADREDQQALASH